MPNLNNPAIASVAPDTEDVYDDRYQDSYGITSASAGPYPRQDCSHNGQTIAMTSQPVSGDWVVPAVGGFLLINNTAVGPVTVILPLDAVDNVEPAGSRTLTLPAGTTQPPEAVEEEGAAPILDEAGNPVLEEGLLYPMGVWGILPVPPQVYGYEPLPIIFQGVPNVAYLNVR